MTLAWLVALLVAIPAAAHEGEGGRVVVPGDHVQPGQTITVLGLGIGGGQVSLRLAHGETSVDLGRAAVEDDGTFEAVATVPGGFPLGYAELTATEEDGHAISAIILVGDRAEGPGSQAGAGDPAGAGGAVDARALGVVLLGVGLVVFVVAGAWYLRGRVKGSANGS